MNHLATGKFMVEKSELLSNNNIKSLLVEFYNCSKNITISSLGCGLINQTYLIQDFGKNPTYRFVLQKINDHVFSCPQAIVDNAYAINQHLNHKKTRHHYPFAVMNHLPQKNGSDLVLHQGEYWRALDYQDNSYNLEEISSNEEAYKVANAFANFAAALADLPEQSLKIIIPDFLNINTRLQELESAHAQTTPHLLKSAQSLYQKIKTQVKLANEINQLTPQLPKRIAHHDTKINNLLFSKHTHDVMTVIDLDTCMPGYLMYDFGDMVRSCCSNLKEDDPNTQHLKIDLALFSSFAQGYIKPLRHIFTSAEKQSLSLGVLLLPYILSMRFLADYLNGDRYFKTSYATHNLDRANNQMALFLALQDKRPLLEKSIQEAFNSPEVS